ncbi:MAG: hypothetical protein HUJ69_09830 [Lachnospiraceae bacterium]|nr:hypothetical protein [Lachnospiraceae bacterium]
MYLSKADLLSFFEFLSQREITIVPFTRTHFSIFNGRHTTDCTDEVRKLAEYIKSHAPEDCYRKGVRQMSRYETNCNHKFMPELIYLEDLEEYLAGLFEDEKRREYFLNIICNGGYKQYLREKGKPEKFSEEFDLWARAYRPIPNRLCWPAYFPFDFEFWLDKYRHRCVPEKIVFANRTSLRRDSGSDNGTPGAYVFSLK